MFFGCRCDILFGMDDFSKIEEIFKKSLTKDLVLKVRPNESKAKGDKKQVHLYGKKEVSIVYKGRTSPKRQSYICGLIEQKDYIGFYSMPIYSHPQLNKLIDKDFLKLLKGKSCFHVKKVDDLVLKNIKTIIKEGVRIYKKEKWI